MTRILKLIPITALLLILWLAPGCINEPDRGSIVRDGQQVPDFSVTLNDGTVADNETLRGRGGLILFFSTGCADCRMELPEVNQAYRMMYGEAGQHMENGTTPLFICIARAQTDPDIAAYWKLQDFTLPYSPQPDRKIYSLFAEQGIPRIYIVSRDLMIRKQYGDTGRPTAQQLFEDLSGL